MKRNIILFIVAPMMALFLHFCTDVTSTMPIQQTPVIMPLAIGNYWIYKFGDVDSSGAWINSTFDTLTIIKDTIVDNERWFIRNETNPSNKFAFNMYLINRTSGLLMRNYIMGDSKHLITFPAQKGNISIISTADTGRSVAFCVKVIDLDVPVNVPKGAFLCYKYAEGLGNNWDSTAFSPIIDVCNYYAVGVGKAKSEYYAIDQTKHGIKRVFTKSELIEAKIQ